MSAKKTYQIIISIDSDRFNFSFKFWNRLPLQACGLMLLFAGFSLFIDSERILLSRLVGASSDILLNLPHPFFYYVALGLAIAGLFAIFASFIGWWATCLKSYCVLSIVGGLHNSLVCKKFI